MIEEVLPKEAEHFSRLTTYVIMYSAFICGYSFTEIVSLCVHVRVCHCATTTETGRSSQMEVYVCTYVYVRMYVCMYVCMCVCMYVCVYVCTYVCMYVRMYVCMYALRCCKPDLPLYISTHTIDPPIIAYILAASKLLPISVFVAQRHAHTHTQPPVSFKQDSIEQYSNKGGGGGEVFAGRPSSRAFVNCLQG